MISMNKIFSWQSLSTYKLMIKVCSTLAVNVSALFCGIPMDIKTCTVDSSIKVTVSSSLRVAPSLPTEKLV